MLSKVPVFGHDDEPVPGLPTRLPDGEYIAWQGRPAAGVVARRVVKTRWIAGYFVVMAAWAVAVGLHDALHPAEITFQVIVLALLGGVVVGLLRLFAWGVQRTTLYTITNRRLVLRIGVALSVTVNLPFRQIASADMNRNSDGSGDIVFKLTNDQRLSWFVLWPHVRPWQMKKPEPALRCIADVETVSDVLRSLLTEAETEPRLAPAVHVTRQGADHMADVPIMAAE